MAEQEPTPTGVERQCPDQTEHRSHFWQAPRELGNGTSEKYCRGAGPERHEQEGPDHGLLQDIARGSFAVSGDRYTPDALAQHHVYARDRLERIKAEVRADERAKRPDREQFVRMAQDAHPGMTFKPDRDEFEENFMEGVDAVLSSLALEPDAREEPTWQWRDCQGDIWTPGEDGLLHSHETAPFPREHVEKKWGPLVQVSRSAPEAREVTDAEVEAAALVLQENDEFWWGWHWDELPPLARQKIEGIARTMLEAAREVSRG